MIISMLFCFSGCSIDNGANKDYNNTGFTCIATCEAFDVVYDNDTFVMYSVSTGYDNFGNVTMLVNPDGSPKLYNGGK